MKTIKDFLGRNAFAIVGTLLILLVMAGGGALFMRLWYGNKVTEQATIITALTDTVKYTRNQNGSLTAEKAAFQTDKAKTFLSLKTKDSTILKLQKLVKDNEKPLDRGGSATVFNSETHLGLTVPTKVTGLDSIIKVPNIGPPTITIWPVYTAPFRYDKWAYGSVVASHDSTHVELHVHNEYEAVVGQFGGFFSNKAPEVRVTTKSPLDSIKDVAAYVKSYPKMKRWGLVVTGGYGAQIQTKPTLGFFIGAGIGYIIGAW